MIREHSQNSQERLVQYDSFTVQIVTQDYFLSKETDYLTKNLFRKNTQECDEQC